MLDKIKKICKEKDVKLLYVCKFGSHLYGTNTPESDTDYKGIFLPSKKMCYLNKIPKSITEDSKKSNQSKNTKEDIDLQLWSLTYFLEMVSKGETNSLDLLYSFTYPEMIVYKDKRMDKIFNNHNKLYNLKDCHDFIKYTKSQIAKYGIRGTRLGVLKGIYEYLKVLNGLWNCFDVYHFKLNDFMDNIIAKFYDESYCFKKEIKGMNSLVLCGKVHNGTISMSEFFKRVKKAYNQYGERAEKARKNEGIDWKAMSHAARAIMQMEELITNGFIQYPLKNRLFLTLVKNGEVDFQYLNDFIYDNINKVSLLLKDIKGKKPDRKLIDEIIVGMYNRKLIDEIIVGMYKQPLKVVFEKTT